MQGFWKAMRNFRDTKKRVNCPRKGREKAPVQTEDIPAPAPAQEASGPGDETAWQPASLDDMDEAERAALEPLLKNVGDCNIYIENKK